jgi:uncharacterized damage-inducible protein DinB
MKLIDRLLKEFNQEAEITRKMLSRVPDDKFDWKPHPKSMDIRTLATHLADIPYWVTLAIETDELDFNNTYEIPVLNSTKDVLALFENKYGQAKESLKNADESKFDEIWTMRKGETIFVKNTRYEIIRVSIAQTIHHRAQMGVFLRLLNIPIPGSYGPSADEPSF